MTHQQTSVSTDQPACPICDVADYPGPPPYFEGTTLICRNCGASSRVLKATITYVLQTIATYPHH